MSDDRPLIPDELLTRLKRSYDAGDRRALFDALFAAWTNRAPPPDWVMHALLRALSSYDAGEAPDFGTAIGLVRKGRHADILREQYQPVGALQIPLIFEICGRVDVLVKYKGLTPKKAREAVAEWLTDQGKLRDDGSVFTEKTIRLWCQSRRRLSGATPKR